LSPLKAIKLRCKDCAAGSRKEVLSCNEKECALNEFRFGKKVNGKISTKAIRKYCLEYCCLNQIKELELCPDKACSLHLFRFGKNPNKKGNINNLKAYQKHAVK
jgi:hypothetical protein